MNPLRRHLSGGAVAQLIGDGMRAPLRHPDAFRAVRDAPEADECLRFDSPVQIRVRLLREDVEIDGRCLRAGRRGILPGAANRDPERFPDPDHLMPARAAHRHLAFGYGSTSAWAPRSHGLEGTVAIDALLRRFPRIALASDVVRWRSDTTMRGSRRCRSAIGDGRTGGAVRHRMRGRSIPSALIRL